MKALAGSLVAADWERECRGAVVGWGRLASQVAGGQPRVEGRQIRHCTGYQEDQQTEPELEARTSPGHCSRAEAEAPAPLSATGRVGQHLTSRELLEKNWPRVSIAAGTGSTLRTCNKQITPSAHRQDTAPNNDNKDGMRNTKTLRRAHVEERSMIIITCWHA